jgi:hypothetical protein
MSAIASVWVFYLELDSHPWLSLVPMYYRKVIMSSRRKFRILALDGGGIRGLITARILQDVEKHIQQKTGKTINTYFDLIAGTSTGSILAAGLVLGIKPEKMVNIYLHEGQTIFPNDLQNLFSKYVTSWFHGAKYSNEGLKNVLQAAFQQQVQTLRPDLQNYNIKFGEIHECLYGTAEGRARLLILAHNTLQRQTTFFISPAVDDPKPWYDQRQLWEVCVSSAAAPTFFPPYCFKNSTQGQSGQMPEHTYIDGGVSANTPSLAALVHALDIENKSLDEIAIMSIGTGRTTTPYESEKISRWGALEWVNALADVFMGSQIQVSADLCGQLLRSCGKREFQDGLDPYWNYLRLQFGLNQRIDDQGNFLPEAEQYNPYLYDALLKSYAQKTGFPQERLKNLAQKEAKLSEEMDNAELTHLQKLLRATEAFLADQSPYRKYQCDLNIQQSIAQFIAQN